MSMTIAIFLEKIFIWSDRTFDELILRMDFWNISLWKVLIMHCILSTKWFYLWRFERSLFQKSSFCLILCYFRQSDFRQRDLEKGDFWQSYHTNILWSSLWISEKLFSTELIFLNTSEAIFCWKKIQCVVPKTGKKCANEIYSSRR